jgi:ATP-dependent DNA ligase
VAPAAAARHHTNAARCAAHARRFGLPLVPSRVHWVRPKLVVEVKFLAWTEDNPLRQVVYEGPREDKPPL